MGKRKNPLILPDKSNKHKKEKIFTPLNPTDVVHLTGAENPACPVEFENHSTGVDPAENQKLLAEKTIEDIVLLFGEGLGEARKRYRHFVKQGVSQGSRPELQGGGLVRSAGGKKGALLGRKKEDRELSDERILGSGDFVDQVLKDADDLAERKNKNRIKISELISRVCQELKLVEDEIYSCSRKRIVSRARCIISFLAVREMGYKTTEVARGLTVGQPNISRAVEKGRRLISEEKNIKENVLYKA